MKILNLIFLLIVISHHGYSQFPRSPLIYGPFKFQLENQSENIKSPDTEFQWQFEDNWVVTDRRGKDLNLYSLDQHGIHDSIKYVMPSNSTFERLIRVNGVYYFLISNFIDGKCILYSSNEENIINVVLLEFEKKFLNESVFRRKKQFLYKIDSSSQNLYFVSHFKKTQILKFALATGTIEWQKELLLSNLFHEIDYIFFNVGRLFIISHSTKMHSFKYHLSEMSELTGITKKFFLIYPDRLITLDLLKFSSDGKSLYFAGISTKSTYFNRIKTHDPYIAKMNLYDYNVTFSFLPELLKGKSIIWQDLIENGNNLRLIGEGFDRETEELGGGVLRALTSLASVVLTNGALIFTVSSFTDKITTKELIDVYLENESLIVNETKKQNLESTNFNFPYVEYHEGINLTSYFKKYFRYRGHSDNSVFLQTENKLYAYNLNTNNLISLDFINKPILDYSFDLAKTLYLPSDSVLVFKDNIVVFEKLNK